MYGTCCVFNWGLPLSLLYVLRTVEKGEWGGGQSIFVYARDMYYASHYVHLFDTVWNSERQLY